MGKVADRYFKVEPWRVVEEGFAADHGRIAESIFSLGNEYMGVRGFFDEGYSGDRLTGVYLNGVYEESVGRPSPYRGIVNRICFMANTVDWLFTRLTLDGETLDLAHSKFRHFTRSLDLRSGLLERSFIWTTGTGKQLRLTFERLLSMQQPKLGCQRVTVEPLNFSGDLDLRSALDFSPLHESRRKSLFDVYKQGEDQGRYALLGRTKKSKHMVYAAFNLRGLPAADLRPFAAKKCFGAAFTLHLCQGQPRTYDKVVCLQAEKSAAVRPDRVWAEGHACAAGLLETTFDSLLEENRRYWTAIWNSFDVDVEGDAENLQGIRYCMFQLNQTYHGADPSLNIGAKGLTGEAYNGHAFWDTETYCLPYYLFTNPVAARHLLEYRYTTLPQARDRAIMLDCAGACYPIATLDGTESCDLWQHASLQLQPSTAVAYGIWHYTHVTGDTAFLYGKGIEMLVEISRFLATRGQWGAQTGEFGFFCVMGPDEFQMMVNNNAYTNFMAKKTFEYTLDVLRELREGAVAAYAALAQRLGLKAEELDAWQQMAAAMRIPLDRATGLYEQHDGYFNLPHIDVDAIPIADFPLYSHWSYDRIYRNDMIKQPDVLMFMFLYNQQFSLEAKRVNYDYYEPRCIHESSLSPSIHSIFAAELGRDREAFDLFGFATRLDLDNYNRNTGEGLHLTSIAAAWVNIVYGFGGMRSDGEVLAFSPSIPAAWQAYTFRVHYRGSIVKARVQHGKAHFTIVAGDPLRLRIYGRLYTIDRQGLRIDTPVGDGCPAPL